MKELQLDQFTQYAFLHGLSWNGAGTKAALVRSRCDLENNGYRQDLWLYDGSRFSHLADIGTTRTFFWKDDRHILYPARQGDYETVYVQVDVESGERREYPPLPIKVRELQPLACGKYAVIARIDANYPDYYCMSPAQRQEVQRKWDEDKGFTYLDELPFYCNGDTFVSKKRNALFIADLEAGTCTRVTEPLFFVDYFCTDGDTVYFAGEAYQDKPTLSRKLFRYTVGQKASQCIYGKDGYNVTGLAVCGGRLMMFGNTFTPKGRRRHRAFYRVDPDAGTITLLNDYPHNMMNSVSSDCCFGAGRTVKVDGDAIYFVSTYGHSSYLMRSDRDAVITPVLQQEGELFDFDIRNGKILVIGLYGQKLQEVYAVDTSGKEATLTQISDFNEAVLQDVYVARPQPLNFPSHGLEIEGWVLLPKDFDPKGTYPAILDIHGGPNFDYGTVFYHEMQLWANRGFIVFYCNPEGSEGRGDDFMNVSGRYGCEDYETLMTFTDQVLAAYPQVDTARLCVTGGSYGGFMTNWIIGHTDRFCCAATQRSICNWVSMASTGDHGYHFVYDQMDADLAENPEKMWDQSPLKFLKYVKTPTLVFHSTNDYRCPLEQGLQWFSALKRRGVETRMCIVDGETHELSRGGRPRQRIRRLQELTGWMEKYTKKQ